MSKELGYVLITPYTLRKSRTGGVLGRLMSRTGLDLVAARMIGPSADLVKRYAALIRDSEEIWPDIRGVLSDYIEREMAPTPEGQCHRVMMLLFEGENAVRKLRDAVGGFEALIDGADPRLAGLIRVIRGARTPGGHKCSNAGSIRFRLTGGGMVGVGLLPSHSPGVYELRIYDGERLVDVYRVERAALLNALAALRVPTDNYAFRE